MPVHEAAGSDHLARFCSVSREAWWRMAWLLAAFEGLQQTENRQSPLAIKEAPTKRIGLDQVKCIHDSADYVMHPKSDRFKAAGKKQFLAEHSKWQRLSPPLAS